jgi:hypothetical protein
LFENSGPAPEFFFLFSPGNHILKFIPSKTKLMRYPALFFLVLITASLGQAQVQVAPTLDQQLPIRGFCIGSPRPANVQTFVNFIEKELVPRKVNTLILRVDFNYEYTSHPELRDSSSLSKNDVASIVAVCKKNNIRVIPQINLLGHQSWANRTTNLLRVYPEFDETPHVKMPEKYVWPNPDGLYCKSYCPLHPGVHKVVFELVDELCAAFETDAFHAGMDEVFYIGDDKCPRCGGQDKAELFANEVRTIRDHLAKSNRQLWIWGDRLLDGKSTGLGMWEASMNNTHRAIDMVPKDIMICDWHYERADKTAVYFAMKGFQVVTCPWRNPPVAVEQVNDMLDFRKSATKATRDRYQGMVQTVWSDPVSFMDGFYAVPKKEEKKDAKKDAKQEVKPEEKTPWNTFRALYAEINKLK